MENPEYSPVQYVGCLSFNNQNGIDVGPLEGRSAALNLVREIPVKKGTYQCYKGIDLQSGKVSAIMVVHPDYPGDTLVTDEHYGDAVVGLSGLVGFFCSPKKEYTLKQMSLYIKEIMDMYPHDMKGWHILNSKQFMAASGRMAGSAVSIHVHRDGKGQIDAVKIEFDHLGERDPDQVPFEGAA